MVSISRLAVGACALSLVLGGCTSGSDDPPRERPSASTTTKDPTLESVAQDLLPGLSSAPLAKTNLPARIDIPKQRPSSFMTAPTARAKLGMVRVLDVGDRDEGFADEDVYFLGVDDKWRVLNRGDLGLPASDWPGSDGSGMGAMSPSGTHWAFATNRHIVVLDLLTKKMKFLSLPGGLAPVLGSWTVRNTLLSGYVFSPPDDEGEDLPTTGYEVDPKSGRSTLINAPYWTTTVLANGDRAVGGLRGDRPFVEYMSAANRPKSRAEYGFAWGERLGMLVQPEVDGDVGVFLDSLGLPDSPSEGSMVAVVDQSLRLKATLPWPKRTQGDAFPGWTSDGTFLLTYGETLAAWCPGQAKISRVSTVPNDLAVSIAMGIVNASCT